MYRSNKSVTGTNESPLGAPRRWGAGGGASAADSNNDRAFGGYGAPAAYTSAPSAPRSEAPPPSSTSFAPAERKRKSRWGAETEKVSVVGMPVAIGGSIDAADLDRYAATIRLEQVNNKLRTGDVVPPERERSASPPPTYDGQGRRTNTRDIRYRKRLEEERTRLIERLIKIDPSFRPPPDYEMQKRLGMRGSNRPSEKVYIPIKEFPEIKFFGLLVGPRGNSLKKMEQDSGAKISIRGRGSVKEGKGRREEFAGDDDDEMHCLVTAETQDKVDACVKLINKVIETACSVPESQNEQKLNQLRELAQLNGTFRDFENQVCQNCGNAGHRKYDCPEQRNWTAGIICRTCGDAGHMARDCLQRRGYGGGPPQSHGGPPHSGHHGGFDSEYDSLMRELGGGGGGGGDGGGGGEPGGGGNERMPTHESRAPPAPPMPGGAPPPPPSSSIPPWRDPSNWQPPQPPPQQNMYGQRNNYMTHSFVPQQQGYNNYYAQ